MAISWFNINNVALAYVLYNDIISCIDIDLTLKGVEITFFIRYIQILNALTQ